MSKSKLRGHYVTYMSGEWLYEDTMTPTVGVERACGACGLDNIIDGHEAYDGCIGRLPNAMNACCGHGLTGGAYIQYWDDNCIKGEKALIKMGLKKRKDSFIGNLNISECYKKRVLERDFLKLLDIKEIQND